MMIHTHVLINCDHGLPYEVVLSEGENKQVVPVKNCSLSWVKRKMLEMFPQSTIEIRGEVKSE